MKAFLSCILSVCLVVNSVIPALAQVPVRRNTGTGGTVVPFEQALMQGVLSSTVYSGMMSRSAYGEYIRKHWTGSMMELTEEGLDLGYVAYVAQNREIAEGERWCKENGGTRCIREYKEEVKGVKREVVEKALKDGESVEVKIRRSVGGEAQTHDLLPFSWGVLNGYLWDVMSGPRAVGAEEYYHYVKGVNQMIADYGYDVNNQGRLEAFFKGVLDNAEGKCKGPKEAAKGVKREAAGKKSCEAVSLAMAWYGFLREHEQNGVGAETIYKAVKGVYNEPYGMMALPSGVGALLALDTKAGTEKVYQLLMSGDTIRERKVTSVWRDLLGLISLEEWNKKGIMVANGVRGGGGNYLNMTGSLGQYIDEKAALAGGLSQQQLERAKEAPQEAFFKDNQLAYNLPYGNVLEDIGVMIAERAAQGNAQAQGLAKRMVKEYQARRQAVSVRSLGNRVHLPLMVGLLSQKGTGEQAASRELYFADFWDLNEGTQRRVNNLVGAAAGLPVLTRDAAKMRRAKDNAKVRELGLWGDGLLTVIFMGSLVMSIPAIVRSAGQVAKTASRVHTIKAASRVRAIKAAGRGEMLKSVRSGMKARGVTPEAIQTARVQQAAKAQARAKEAAQTGAKAQEATQPVAKAQGTQEAVQEPGIEVMDANGQAYRYDVKTGEITPIEPKGVRTGTEQLRPEDLVATVGEGGGGSAAAKAPKPSEKRAQAVRKQLKAAERVKEPVVPASEIQAQAAALRETKALKGHRKVRKIYIERGGVYYRGSDGVKVNDVYHEMQAAGEGKAVIVRADGRMYVQKNSRYVELGKTEHTPTLRELLDWYRIELPYRWTVKSLLHPDRFMMAGALPFGTTAEVVAPVAVYAQAGRSVESAVKTAEGVSQVSQVGQAAKTAKSFGQPVSGGLNTLQVPHIVSLDRLDMPGTASLPISSTNLLNPQWLSEKAGRSLVQRKKESPAATAAADADGVGIEGNTNEESATQTETPILQMPRTIFGVTPQYLRKVAAMSAGAIGLGLMASDALGLVPGASGVTGTVTGATLAGLGAFFARHNGEKLVPNVPTENTPYRTAGRPNRIRLLWNKLFPRTAPRYANEDPTLHSNNVNTVYESVPVDEDPEDAPLIINESIRIPAFAKGFKLTFEPLDGKIEHIIPNVDVTSFVRLPSGYNRLALSSQGILELRNENKSPQVLSNFVLYLNNTNGALWHFLQSPAQLDITSPVLIKLERGPRGRKIWVTLDIELEGAQKHIPVKAQIDRALLPKGFSAEVGKIWVKKDGSIYYTQYGKKPVLLQDVSVRLPKGGASYWVPMLAAVPNIPFTVQIFSTDNKLGWITRGLSFHMLGVGKTVASILAMISVLSDPWAVGIMLGINSVLPYLITGATRKKLEYYNDVTIMRQGFALITLGCIGAAVSGALQAHMTLETLIPFLLSLTAVTVGTNLVRVAQDPLIVANLGGKKAPKKDKQKRSVGVENVTYTRAWFHDRLKQVWNNLWSNLLKRGERDELGWRLTSQTWKNIGGVALMASPYIINKIVSLWGWEWHLDFRHSFIILAVSSIVTLGKILSLSLKENIPDDANALKEEMTDSMTEKIDEFKQQAMTGEDITQEQMKEAVLDLYKLLGKWAISTIRQDKQLMKQEMLEQGAKWAQEQWKTILMQSELPQEQIQRMADSFDKLLTQMVNPEKAPSIINKFPKVIWAALGAITLATFTEMGVATGFAFEIRDQFFSPGVIPDPAYVGILSAVWYFAMAASRTIGNFMTRMRLRPGTMYLVSSLFSAVGISAMMIAMASHNNLLTLIGAGIACIGVGNFFAQVSKYVKDLAPERLRDTQLWMGYTMVPGALLTTGLKFLVNGYAWGNLVLLGVSLLTLGTSLLLTKGLLAQSDLLQAAKQKRRARQNETSDSQESTAQDPTRGPSTDWDHTAPAH